MCGSKPSAQQNQAAASQSRLSDTMAGIAGENQAVSGPFWRNQIREGLPFFNQLTDYSGGTLARSFAPGRANLERRLSSMGPLPSGFATQARTGMDVAQGRAFDDQMLRNLMLQQEAKEQAARGLSPLPYFGGAQQGYASILGLPVQPNALGGILGGAGSAAMGAALLA